MTVAMSRPVIITDDSLVYDPAADRSAAAAVARAAAVAVPGAIEDRARAILGAPAAPGETIAATFARKERELCAVLAELRPAEALVLHRRLIARAPGDALAIELARLAPERRTRLIVFVGDARLRDAVRRRA